MRKTKRYKRKRRKTRKVGGFSMNKLKQMASTTLKSVPTTTNQMRQMASKGMNNAKQMASNRINQASILEPFKQKISNISKNSGLEPEHKKILDFILANNALILKIIQDKDFSPTLLMSGDETKIKNMIFGIIRKNPTMLMNIKLGPLIKK